MAKFKSALIKIIDFIIGIVVFWSSLYGTTLFINELLGFPNIESISLILAILMLARVINKLSNTK